MNTTKKQHSHFYNLLADKKITVNQFLHIADVLFEGEGFNRRIFNDEQFNMCLSALNYHARENGERDNTRYNYSFGKNHKFPTYTGKIIDLAETMYAEYNILVRRMRSREAIKMAYEAGALRVESTGVDLSQLPLVNINGVKCRVALIAEN